MEKLKINLFDFFGHVIPGSFLLLSIVFCLDLKIIDFNSMRNFVTNLNGISIGLFVLLAYVVSTTFHETGYLWFKHVGKRLWKNRSKCNGEEKIENENFAFLNATIRQFSPDNAAIINEWAAKRAMAFNLSFSFLVIFFVSIIKLLINNDNNKRDWITLLVISFFSTILILRRARTFHDWYYDDIFCTIKMIEMDRRIILLNIPKIQVTQHIPTPTAAIS